MKNTNIFSNNENAFSDITTPAQAEELRQLLNALMLRIDLAKSQKSAMYEDFCSVIRHYLSDGVSIAEIKRRLHPEKLGYFYYEKPDEWYALDTAATIYPLSMSRGWMPIFRLSAYLKEEVIPEILQLALTFTIKRFPYFSVTLGRGFFWDYMDSTRRRFSVRQESRRPFTVMNLSKANAPCFRVMYYKNRISLEVFHLLTDGTGGTIFLKTLVAEYFRLLGFDVPTTCDIKALDETPDPREWSNDFHLAQKAKASGFAGKTALQLKGSLSATRPHQILHFEMDATKLKQVARDRNATVTALLLTYFFFACKASVAPGRGKIQIQVPCNMRKYYSSITMRNFAMYAILCMHPNEVTDFDDVLKRISKELEEGTSMEALTRQMIASTRLVRSLNFVPMFLKAPIAQHFYPFFSDLILTTTLSNLGVVQLPDSIADKVDRFDFILGTTTRNRASCSIVTYQNKAVLSICKATDHPGFEENLRILMEKDGITPIVTGSEAHGFHRCISEN